MGIYERKGTKGISNFQVKLRRKGLPPMCKSFPTLEEAKEWEREIKEILAISNRNSGILPLIAELVAETGKPEETIFEEALRYYAAHLRNCTSPEPTRATVNKTSAVKPVRAILDKPLSETLSSAQLQQRIAELEKFVSSIKPKITYSPPSDQEYPIMVEVIKRYEQLLFGKWRDGGVKDLYAENNLEYEFVMSMQGLVEALNVTTDELKMMIARGEIPRPAAYSIEWSKSANQQVRESRTLYIPAPDSWTLMQTAAILVGYGKQLAERDVSPNWYRYVISESEMALLMSQAIS